MTNKKNCCSERRTLRSDEQKRALSNRLKRIEGQLRGISAMIDNDAYCNDVLIQAAAASAALKAFSREVLDAHIHTCVIRDIREGKDETADELIEIIKKLQ